MADLRLIGAVLGLGLLGAGPASADAPTVTVPAGWRELPKVAAALAEGARADGVTVETSAAWGDPGRGCFAVSLALRGGPAATPEQLVASVPGARDVVKSGSEVSLAFERAPFRGRVHATLAGDEVSALACFGDGREPTACEAACAQVVPR